jgi:hypothetical protein
VAGTLYPHLVEVVNRWNQAIKIDVRYPTDHAEYLEQCHEAVAAGFCGFLNRIA